MLSTIGGGVGGVEGGREGEINTVYHLSEEEEAEAAAASTDVTSLFGDKERGPSAITATTAAFVVSSKDTLDISTEDPNATETKKAPPKNRANCVSIDDVTNRLGSTTTPTNP